MYVKCQGNKANCSSINYKQNEQQQKKRTSFTLANKTHTHTYPNMK